MTSETEQKVFKLNYEKLGNGFMGLAITGIFATLAYYAFQESFGLGMFVTCFFILLIGALCVMKEG